MTICSCPRHDTNGYLTSRVREDGNNYGIQGPETRKRIAILDIKCPADISLFKKVLNVKHLPRIFIPMGSGTFHLAGKNPLLIPRRATRHLDWSGDRNRSQRRSKSRHFEWYVIGRAMNRASIERGKKRTSSSIRRGKPEKRRKERLY